MLTQKLIWMIISIAVIAGTADALRGRRRRHHKRRMQRYRHDLQSNHPSVGHLLPELGTPVHVSDMESCANCSVPKSRQKRAGMWAWQENSEFVAEFSFEVPMYAPDHVANTLIWEQDFEFLLPNGTSKIFYKRSIDDRLDIYSRMEQLFDKFGYDGQACVFKAICEKSEHNFFRGGFLGDIFDILLTVSDIDGHESSMLEYAEAEAHGKAAKSCVEKYSTCSMSLFHIFDDPY